MLEMLLTQAALAVGGGNELIFLFGEKTKKSFITCDFKILKVGLTIVFLAQSSACFGRAL